MFLMIICAVIILKCHSFVIPNDKAVRPWGHLQIRTTTSSVAISSKQGLFGGIFGTNEAKLDDELALYPKLASSDLKFDSLVEYLQQWAQLFDGKGMGLTTPVTIRAVNNVLDKSSDDVVKASGVQILFLKVETGYKDKDEKEEEDAQEKRDEKEVKQGGVEILVEQLQDSSVQIRARRCEMDDDTMIKEMSEETILKELKTMINVWKKEH